MKERKESAMLSMGSVPHAFAAAYCEVAAWVARKVGNASRVERLKARVEHHVQWCRFFDYGDRHPPGWW